MSREPIRLQVTNDYENKMAKKNTHKKWETNVKPNDLAAAF